MLMNIKQWPSSTLELPLGTRLRPSWDHPGKMLNDRSGASLNSDVGRAKCSKPRRRGAGRLAPNALGDCRLSQEITGDGG